MLKDKDTFSSDKILKLQSVPLSSSAVTPVSCYMDVIF